MGPTREPFLQGIHNGVIAVFQRKGLPDQELFTLNEGVRQLLKTELGSFFTEYLQNQLLTKGMVILRDKIRFYEGEWQPGWTVRWARLLAGWLLGIVAATREGGTAGQKLLDSLAETWDFFFSDVLPTLQAIFYPVQGKEPPEHLVDRILESVDSDSEGIFIDFGRRSGSGASEFEGARGRQSIV
ncbi:Proline-rich protein 5 [Myotis brandtii]|uniref:Proline-rich protein 5 n=1 Tax=Myotis brandtii TaxID=109478 RepID=S7P8Z7_MYOBR|nr:Proline-rich protein 5 [Myotis brandtii]